MSKFAKGKYALAISDRSGQAFPWREMVTEWNGAFVHLSEYEPKQPQLEPKPFVADPQGLEQAQIGEMVGYLDSFLTLLDELMIEMPEESSN